MTEAPTPQYNIGDRVEIPHRKLEGEVSDRWYSEQNESWVYQVACEEGSINISVYQEKSLIQ